MAPKTAFGRMVRELASLGVINIRTEPLDRAVERRLKHLWRQRSCPECDVGPVYVGDSCDRVWCGRCSFCSTYTRGTPFYDAELAPGEFLVALVLYADSLLPLTQIATLLNRNDDTVRDAVRKLEPAFHRGFAVVWERLDREIDGPTQIDETYCSCSGYKGQEPPRAGLSRGGSSGRGRSRWTGEQGDQATLVAASRDVLRVVSAENGATYEDHLEPVLEEAEELSEELEEVWTDGYRAYEEMEHDHRQVVHDETYVSSIGVHVNQVESLWSVLQPWLGKFRGLSREGLDKAVRSFGFMRSLTLARAPVRWLIDAISVNLFRKIG